MNYKFLREETGQEEKVVKEIWCWEATYEDGTSLKQFSDDGFFHQFGEIDQERLNVFKMKHDDGRTFTLLFNPATMKLIHFYRMVRSLNTNQLLGKLYVFGYETNEFGKTEKHLMAITHDGELIVTDDIGKISMV